MITTAPAMAPVTMYVGRQPIFDRSLETVAYELLFRGAADASSADVVDGCCSAR
jgi:c-di-GMP-related signal transduction protein